MMIRKVFVRAMGSNSTILNRTISSLPPSLIQSHSFSTGAPTDDKDAVDATLYKLLKHEIKSLKFTLSNDIPKVNEARDYFPFQIEVDDYRRDRRIKLARKFLDGEEVTIEIDMMNAINMKEMESSKYDDDKESMKEASIPMTVKVYKQGRDGDYIEFEITLSKQDITVQRFATTNKEEYEDFVYNGPKEMDSVLQQCLCKYLEIRGIKTNIASNLLEYIAMENKKVDLSMLKLLHLSTILPLYCTLEHSQELDNELQQSLYKYLEIRGIKSSIASTLLEYIAVKNNRHYLAALKDLVEIIDD